MWKMLSDVELKELETRQAAAQGYFSEEAVLLAKNRAQGGCCQIQQSPPRNNSSQPLYSSTPMPEQGKALKFDSGKPDLSQVSLELVEELAKVRMFGEKKYARDNWKKGFKVTRSLSAALRHIFRFLAGETLDSESGLSHLGHAVACLEHAIWDMKHHPENDDRYKKGAK